MTHQAMDDLLYSLASDASGAYLLPCRKAFLQLKLSRTPAPLRFRERDNVRFRIGEDGLTVENRATGAMRARFAWREIESIAVGEPETDSGLLFQG